jgi:hypothetical protein
MFSTCISYVEPLQGCFNQLIPMKVEDVVKGVAGSSVPVQAPTLPLTAVVGVLPATCNVSVLCPRTERHEIREGMVSCNSRMLWEREAVGGKTDRLFFSRGNSGPGRKEGSGKSVDSVLLL